jgi:hypothetical protein
MASGTPRKNNLRVGFILLTATLLYMGALVGYMIIR